MSLRPVRATAAALTMTVAAIACSSVPEVTFSDDGGTTDPDGSLTFPDGAPRPDGGVEDARPDPSCVPMGPENCEDGLDNDCNGKIDCEDPACTPTHQCVDAIPTGWSLVAFNATSRSDSCPTGYGTALDLKSVTGTGSGGSCSCSCAPTSGSCGDYTVTLSNTQGTCGGTTTTQSAAVTGNCTALTTPMAVPNVVDYFGVATAPTLPTTCGDTRTKTNVPQITSGRACPGPAALGKGCPNNGACVRKPTSFPQVCVSQTGQVSCPATGYTQRRTGGNDASTDGRDCNTCDCVPASCGGSIQLFDQADCTVGGNKKTTGPLIAACAQLTDKNFTATHYRVNTATNGCSISGLFSPTVIGSIAWDQPRTICCRP